MMDFFRAELETLRERNLYRRLKWFHGPQAAHVVVDGHPCILLASNNYLGLTEHPAVKEGAVQAALDWGTGAGGSRLISGNYLLYHELERRIAEFKKTEEAVVFSSGYLTNLGTISVLVGRGDAILSDELNHASIIDGCRLSRADVFIYRHKDLNHLEKLLREAQNYRRRLIITDGVFSVDGDLAPLPEIVALAKKYRALLMVDDAHATGIFGQRGAGTAEHFGLEGRIDVQMGTLSKALASAGGYVAGKRDLIDYLRNRARTFIFNTGLPPAAVGAALAALEVVQNEPELRARLWENAGFLRAGLIRLGYRVLSAESPIIPVLIGEESKTITMTGLLLKKGVFVSGVRPPTVPPGTSRLRVSVMATHKKEDLDEALEAFREAGQETGVI